MTVYPVFTLGDVTLRDVQLHESGQDALEHIIQIYEKNIATLKEAYHNIAKDKPVDHEALTRATYPYVGFNIRPENACKKDSYMAYGLINNEGVYGTTITNPRLFYSYLLEQFNRIITNHNVPAIVGESYWKIPFPYAIPMADLELTEEQGNTLRSTFTFPDLTRINDDIANGVHMLAPESVSPLSLYTGERTDFSLNRLHHYTNTHPEHFQQFILLTNYQRYIPDFLKYALDLVQNDPEYTDLIVPGDRSIFNVDDIEKELQHQGHSLPQMPTYHLKRRDKNGITFVNIGVGPSNAKTITDHLSVLRPHCWIMIGHCGGLRKAQSLGDYVLAHAYLRDDHVLDDDLPPWVPIPSIAEIQLALMDAIQDVTKLSGHELGIRTRTGTVATTDNRNWELKIRDLYQSLRQSRSIAVDMESATIAANGLRFRVPYGTLLCVSDKPVHGEPKLRGMANRFYQERVKQHLQIGLKTVEMLRSRGVAKLHSRKLRGFHEVPFR